MKPKNYQNCDFSNIFNNLTIKDTIQTTEKKKDVKNTEKFIPDSKFVSYTELHENFLPRMMRQEKVIPDRYVWHVTDDQNSDFKRFSIAKEGLKAGYGNFKAVFANNGLSSITHFYPLNIEVYMWRQCRDYYRPFLRDMDEAMLLCDFWRIDTHAFNAEWSLDPNMKSYNRSYKNSFICTTQDIPADALSLYKVDPDVFYSNLSGNIQYGKKIFPVSMLIPNKRVNNWIKHNRYKIN